MTGPAGFVHLRCHSSYSFLDGASSVEALAAAAAAQGQDALALTDTGGLYGAVRFWNAARERGIRAIFGCELTLLDLPGGMVPVALLAEDRTGWTSLCRIVSAAQLAGHKGQPQATLAQVASESAGLIALSESDDPETLGMLHEVFGDRLYAELVDRWGPEDIARADARAEQAAAQGIATVVTHDVRYARPEDRRLHDVLRCIALGTTVDAAGRRLAANGERWLKGEAELRARLGHHPEAFANARRIADRCVVDLGFGYQRLPGFSVPAGHTAFSFLYTLCGDGARMKYGRVTPKVSRQLAHELDVIDRCGLAEFFLINWDIVRFCNERRIPAQGRGSAADSIVAYVLDITKVDPIAHDLLFERFLTEDSHTMPDIDLDIASNDREEVIQYVYRRYGERYAAMVCNVVTYRPRSASREVAKALGFRDEIIDRLSKLVDTPRYDSRGPHGAFVTGRDPQTAPAGPEELNALERQRWPLYEALRAEIADLPRHLSIHNGGMLITALPLVDTVPIERATMPGRNVVQFDKRDIEDLGLIKMDLLGLRTLSLIKDCVAMIDELHAVRLDLGTIPLEDPAVYDLLCEVDTIGVFQVESRAQGQALPRVRPRCFADIVVQVAIIRPGPLQGNMVNPYIRRRQGREPVTYLHPLLEPILKETLGVILFQEQILKVAMAVAGFSASEADRLRRAMSRARSSTDMERLREPFVRGALARGLDDPTANEIFRQVAAFAEFGFCKSHAAAFALTAYHTAHLKLYYPAEFVVALLNNQPMGFYSPAVIAGDAKRHGIAVLPVDVGRSAVKAAIEEREGGSGAAGDLVADRSVTIARHRACAVHDLRLGLTAVKGLGEEEAGRIVAEREMHGPFRSFDDFARRVGMKEEALRNLALVGAFDRFGEPPRALLWRAHEAHRGSPAFTRPVLAYPATAAPALPALGEQERAALDYRITGIPIGPQIMRFYRERLRSRGVGSSADLQGGAHGQAVQVAGAIVVKQHPETAKGHVFLSLEDEYGLLNVIIRPATYATYKRVVDQGGAVVVGGTLQHVDGVISVLARRLDELSLFVKLVSRDWQ